MAESDVELYYKALLSHQDAMRYLLERRCLTPDCIRKFSLGYCESKAFTDFSRRIMFPVRNEQGYNVGFQARLLYDEPERKKYNHGTLPKAEIVPCLWEQAPLMVELGGVVIVEGHFDAFAFYMSGIPAVPILGTALSDRQALILRRYVRVVIGGFDSGVAGKNADKRCAEVCERADLVYYPSLRHKRGCKDPAEVWEKYGLSGMERYTKYVRESIKDGL